MVEGYHPDPGYELRGSAWVHPRARVGAGAVLEPGVVIGDGVTLGDDSWVGAGAVIYGPTTLGRGNRIYPHAVLGGPPQDASYQGEPTRLEIGDHNHFREGVSVHRGTVKGGGVTRIGSHNLLMADSHVGHDCIVGDRVLLTNAVLLAGHCHVGDQVYMAGRVSIVPFTTVGRNAFITGLSGTTMDVEPFLVHTGVPARPRSVNVVGLRRAGFANASIRSLIQAFKLLFTDSAKGGDDLDAVRGELEREGAMSDEAAELLDFMRRSRAGRHGRMLQAGGGAPPPEEEPAAGEELSGARHRRWGGAAAADATEPE